MCGITGIWRQDDTSVTPDRLKPFTDAIAHRGPDGSGYYVDQSANVGLGHRRLSILDLTQAGHQPMPYADQRYWLTYNGEIYNFIELRRTLREAGHRFRSDCDTEVVAAAYAEWGLDCLEKMNGMWAFAVWDTQEQELTLARDRYGIKPLHYATYENGQAFAFASETIAFAHLPGWTRRFHDDRLRQTIFDPRSLEGYGYTIYQDLYQLLPGHYLRIKPGTSFESIQQRRWWSLPDPSASDDRAYEKQKEDLQDLLRDACSLRMRSDVPLATALSGGVDSSSVYCVLHDLHNRNARDERSPDSWQRAFIASFPGTVRDETEYAEAVVTHTGGTSTVVYPGKQAALDDWVESTVLFDSIYSDPNFVLSTLYGEMRDAGVKVSMDGHGVDEMMYGYTTLVREAHRAAQKTGDADYAERIASIYARMFTDDAHPPPLEKWWKQQVKNAARAVLPESVESAILDVLRRTRSRNHASTRWLPGLTLSNLPPLSDAPIDLSVYDPYRRPLVDHFFRTTLPLILRNFDRASMQHGVEIRMPFMDWRLVDYVFSLPPQSLLDAGYTKRILHDAMSPLLPTRVRSRTDKTGITAPLDAWLGDELADAIQDITHSSAFLNADIWNGPQIRDDVDAMKRDEWTMETGYALWPILNAFILMEAAGSGHRNDGTQAPGRHETVIVEGNEP